MKVWIDVEDIFRFAETGGRRPQGIQRLAFELCQAMRHRPAAEGGVGFVRHAAGGSGFEVTEWAALERLFTGMTRPENSPAVLPAAEARPASGLRSRLRGLLLRLPPGLRDPLRRFLRAEVEGARALAAVLAIVPRLALRRLRRRMGGRTMAVIAAPGQALGLHASPGDFLFAPGAGFMFADHAARVAEAKRLHGLRFALLIYDVIPLRRPEYTGIPHAVNFRGWVDSVLPLCDRIFAISRSAAAETEAYAATAGLVLRDHVRAIPIGAGFSPADPAAQAALPTRALPAPGSYALIVSTIEVRKNHLLLVRAWRRLLDEMPAEAVPLLVFAGRVGWMVDDLMQQLVNTSFLGGKVVLVDHPDDAELAALYRGCLFTLFPSFYEGWGLPVGESLAFGKPCIISTATSLPEVGGDFARYIDPDDVTGATALIRATLEDRPGLAAWEARIRSEYRPTSWNASADAVMAGLNEPLPG